MLHVKNERVIQFYKTHPEFDFELMNLLLVGLLEKISETKNANRDDILLASFKKMESEMTDMKERISSSSQGIINLQTTVASIPKNMTDHLTTQLSTIKDNSIKDIERALESNRHSTSEHIDSKMKTLLLDNFKNILDSNIIQLKNDIGKTNSPREVVDSINKNFQSRCDSLQQFILNLIKQLHESSTNQSEILKDVQIYFDRQKSSNYKGIDSENTVEQGLNKTFPDAIITNTTGQSCSGDFSLERSDKPKIMIENKFHSANVTIPDIEKFIRDAEYQCCHGILVSQKSGISRKKNFQIDIHNGYIMIYIHNADYDFDKIKLAVDAIDHLSIALKQNGSESIQLKVSPDEIKEINDEYQRFLIQRNGLSDSLKLFNRNMTRQISQLEFPELSKVLSQQFTSTEETLFKCEYCKVKVYKNAKALAAHVRKCKNVNHSINIVT